MLKTRGLTQLKELPIMHPGVYKTGWLISVHAPKQIEEDHAPDCLISRMAGMRGKA
jgi:hypothetical protein